MTDPTIPDTAIEAFRAGWLPVTELDEHTTDDEIRAGLAAAYPHLAAAALRAAADAYLDGTRPADGPLDRAGRKLAAEWLRARAGYRAASPGSVPRASRPDDRRGGPVDATRPSRQGHHRHR